MPIIAEAYYQQISLREHADVELTSGQICYEAIAEEPAGKHIASEKSFLSADSMTSKTDLSDYGLRPEIVSSDCKKLMTKMLAEL